MHSDTRFLKAIKDIMDDNQLVALDAEHEERRGECYALALRYFAERPYPDHDAVSIVALCHGYTRPNAPGLPSHDRLLGHAWVELTFVHTVPEHMREKWGAAEMSYAAVWEPITNAIVALPAYYAVNRIDPELVVRWTEPADVLDMLHTSAFVGVWADESQLPEEPYYLPE